jgi:hypothetical protein
MYQFNEFYKVSIISTMSFYFYISFCYIVDNIVLLKVNNSKKLIDTLTTEQCIDYNGFIAKRCLRL